MQSDYCVYPPQPAADLELAEQQDGARVVWMAGAASVGRYLMLGATERNVLALIDGTRTPPQICAAFQQQHGGNLGLAMLTKFLTKLDQTGILAGVLAGTRADLATEADAASQHYLRFQLFNPDRLFARLVPVLRWVWTTEFLVATAALMCVTAWLIARDWAQFAAHATQLLTEHYAAVFLAGTLVVFAHEFAHGLTCKAFGGRATEVGVLLVYYFLPALYCNVSGIHLIPQRRRRLWVIAAGVYWQLLVGSVCLFAWSLVAPETLWADVLLGFGLGSLVDVAFNANPLIKLDGYYFLSQWLRLPNLLDRSRAYWRGLLLGGEEKRYTRREQLIYALYGLLSALYALALLGFILVYVGGWLMDTFYLLGLLLCVGVVLLFARKPLATVCNPAFRRLASLLKAFRLKAWLPTLPRRRVVPLALAMLIVIVLLLPWRASVGSYGTLVALPEREAIIRAPEAATLVQLGVKPGDQLAAGAALGKLGNLDVETQISEVQTDLARAQGDYDRLLGELRVRNEAVVRAAVALAQRQRDFAEIDAEQRQIQLKAQPQLLSQPGGARVITIANTLTNETPTTMPAALAALQAEAEAQCAQRNEAAAQRDRLRALHAQGIIPRSELDAQEARAATLAGTFDAAYQRLDAALIEHRRRHAGTATELRLAETDSGTERLTREKLSGELRGLRELIATLATRRDLLIRKRAQFELTTPRAGWVFGEELPRLTGQFFQKGAEICRVADTRQLLLRIQVPEREIGDVRAGLPVRLKVRAFPAQTFTGTVSKLGSESERDEQGQAAWRVELTIENQDGQAGLLLRPGMTAFARIDYGRQAIGRILAHKFVQVLRPELWLL
ncbi:MAG: HlyD family efflux transporter periplasmic adaptor subunit [Acidobacteria bacterium]|nr:HlyD family efflux transporter periplasmic adaptor subunit [Acidobacteriota bacterium]